MTEKPSGKRDSELRRRAQKRAEWLADLERPVRRVSNGIRTAVMGTHETVAHAYKRLGW